MNRIFMGQDWFDNLLPHGIPIPSSILLSGPGGSGKPLIGNILVAEWLRQGGSVIFMSLQYPDHRFIAAGIKKVAQLDLDNYKNYTAFIELDTSLEGIHKLGKNHIIANVVKPEIWDAALEYSISKLPKSVTGILVFVSALNLLLFSPTFGKSMLEKLKNLAQEEKEITYLFSASTSAKAQEIAELEAVADNLILTRSTKNPFQLFLKVERMTGVPFSKQEITVPFPQEILMEVKEIADHSRKKVIPEILKL